MIFKEALDDTNLGMKINGVTINNIRYADDTVLLADSLEDLQQLLSNINSVGERYGLNINVGKTKLMIFSRESHESATLQLKGVSIERVKQY